jgi:hypothetical protein
MAKEKDPSLSKDERKALKRAEKEKAKKRSDTDGVHKSSTAKESKKEKRKKKERAVLAEKVANAAERGEVVVEDAMEVKVVKSDLEQDEAEGKGKEKGEIPVRPVGALVPFANPLADEKVARKVFKGVKKGGFTSPLNRALHGCMDMPSPINWISCGIPADRAILHSSCSIQIPQTRRQRSRQGAPQIPHHALHSATCNRRPRRRYLPHGRHLPHPRPL